MTNFPYPTGFHLEVTNMCTLECSGCARTRFIEAWPQHWKNYNLNSVDLDNFLDIDITGLTFSLCGNYGDPIYHPKLHDIIKVIKSRGGKIEITTNGSYRKAEWWKLITSLLDETDSITFSIDGIPINFTQYRKNADWKSIDTAIKECVKSRVKTEWKYIIFSFNENNIEEAKQLSESYGIDSFTIKHSDRFDEQTNHLIPTNEKMIGGRRQQQIKFKNNSENAVNPKCKTDRNEHFITATGYYSPCCYIADHRFYYKTQFGKNRKLYSISDLSFSKIAQMQDVVQFYSSIEESRPSACQFNCPAN